MNQLINNTELTMTSVDIADLTGKRHSDVMRDIAVIQDQLGERKFAVTSGYMDRSNRKQSMWIMDHTEVMTLVTGYSVVLRIKVIERWSELENKPVHKLPKTLGEALLLAGNQQLEIETQNKLIELQAPAVKFVENYTQADSGSKGFRQVAKLLKVKENVFRKFLVDNKIMYLLEGDWTAYANHIDAGRFETKTGEYNNRVCNSVKFTGKGIEWIAGLYEQLKTGEEL